MNTKYVLNGEKGTLPKSNKSCDYPSCRQTNKKNLRRVRLDVSNHVKKENQHVRSITVCVTAFVFILVLPTEGQCRGKICFVVHHFDGVVCPITAE